MTTTKTTVEIIDAPRFARAFLAAALAAGDDITLPALTSVALSFNGQGYSLAATDRYRLHIVRCSGDIPSGYVDVVVPAKPVAKFLGTVSRERAQRALTVTVDGDRVMFALAALGKHSAGSLTVDQITGGIATFTVEPVDVTCDTVAGVRPQFMADAMKGAEIITGNKSAPARISPWATGKPIRVRANDGEANRATDYLAVVMPTRFLEGTVAADHVPLYYLIAFGRPTQRLTVDYYYITVTTTWGSDRCESLAGSR